MDFVARDIVDGPLFCNHAARYGYDGFGNPCKLGYVHGMPPPVQRPETVSKHTLVTSGSENMCGYTKLRPNKLVIDPLNIDR
jgi:hypothetical protein